MGGRKGSKSVPVESLPDDGLEDPRAVVANGEVGPLGGDTKTEGEGDSCRSRFWVSLDWRPHARRFSSLDGEAEKLLAFSVETGE